MSPLWRCITYLIYGFLLDAALQFTLAADIETKSISLLQLHAQVLTSTPSGDTAEHGAKGPLPARAQIAQRPRARRDKVRLHGKGGLPANSTHEAQEPFKDKLYKVTASTAVDATRTFVKAFHNQDVRVWPIPAKVCIVLVLFVIFEYFLHWLPFCCVHAPLPDEDDFDVVQSKAEQDAAAVEAGCDTLTVLSLNIWMDRARENVQQQIRAIKRLGPDVVCLQECFHLDVLEAYRSAFPDYVVIAFGKLHTASALFALIAVMLMVATLFSTCITVGEHFLGHDRWRTAWLVAVPVQMLLYAWLVRHHHLVAFLTGNRTGLCTLVKRDKFELDLHSNACKQFSALGQADDFLNTVRPRGYLDVGGFLHRSKDKRLPVRLTNTHLNQPLEQIHGVGRHRQVKEITENCLKDGELFILGCDLNATPPGTYSGSDCGTYPDVVANLTDSWYASNPSDPNRDGLTWDQRENPMCTSLLNTLFFGRALRWRCDFVFWRYGGKGNVPSLGKLDSTITDTGNVPSLGKSASTLTDTVECTNDDEEVSVSVRSCELVFTGKEAVSDHYGVYTVFNIQ